MEAIALRSLGTLHRIDNFMAKSISISLYQAREIPDMSCYESRNNSMKNWFPDKAAVVDR